MHLYFIQNSKFRIKNSHKGFTLIELLLYISISSVLLLLVTLFLSTLLQSRVKNQTVAEVEQQGLYITHLVAQAVRNAESITSPTPGNSASETTLDVVTALDDPTVFDLSGGVIRITEGLGSAVDLSNSRVIISNVTFENLSHTDTNGILRFEFTVTHINPEGRNEYDFTRVFSGSAALRE